MSGGRPFRHVVRVSESEEAQLVVAAARQGVTVPRLLIVCALERSDEITSADKRELLVELFTIHRLLGNMANNINQIARAVNSTGDLPEQTGAVMTALWSTMQRVNREIDRFSLS